MASATDVRWAKERKVNQKKYGKPWTNIEMAGNAGAAFGIHASGEIDEVPMWAQRWWRDQNKKQRITKRKQV